MTRIHVLGPGFTNPNSAAFFFPLMAFSRTLADAGLRIHFYTREEANLTDCDLLLIDHKAITKGWDEEHSLKKLAGWSEQTSLIWCDQADSSGTFLGQVLPYVKRYLKAQLFTDRQQYKQSFYADRIYTDYYHKKHGLTDDRAYYYAPVSDDADLRKLGLSWNSGMMNHAWSGPWLNRLLEKAPLPFLARFPGALGDPASARHLDLTCRMGISYPRKTMRWQREQIRDQLHVRMPTDKLSRRQYFEEMKNSRICLSAFGYGEITLKDFESFLTGTMLLKPDMSHMDTWPNFFEADVTIGTFSWDLDDLETSIARFEEDPALALKIATAAQNRYLQYTAGIDAAGLFLEHFKQSILA